MSYEGPKDSNPPREKASQPAQQAAEPTVAPGKRTRTMGLPSSPAGASAPVQQKSAAADGGTRNPRSRLTAQWLDTAMRPDIHPPPVQQMPGDPASPAGDVHELAAQGIAGPAAPLPHMEQIQRAFGHHDVSGVEAHVGGPATQASEAMGAEAYATGAHVAFRGAPDLHTAAHEAAHVIQQRGGVQLQGGVGQVGDAYERHADAVADRVVQGRPAQDLLDQMGPAAGSASAAPVQALQMSIQSDLRAAMSGWGTDEEAIYARLQRATQAELQAVLADRALMAELRDELSRSEMSRVLDLLRAPLAQKLRLAMSGWGTDEDYIRRSIARASAAELQAVASDDALLDELESELSGEDLRQALDRLNVPLERKLRYAIRGWGTDEQYLFDSIASASGAQATAVAQNAALMAEIDDDLSAADQARLRGALARRIHLDGGNPDLALSLLVSDNPTVRQARLAHYGAIAEQRVLLDAVIAAGTDIARVRQAFELYWNVSTAVDGASDWDVATLQQIHEQCKLLPEQDVRSGGWTRLVRIAGAGGSMDGAGEFRIGEGAAAIGTQPYGVGTALQAPAAAGAATIEVQDPAVFGNGDTIAIGGVRPSPDVHQITAVAGNTYSLDGTLAQAHGAGVRVTPDDDTAIRDVGWVEAVVRHEIAHAVDNVVGASGFYQLGGWWSGDDFDGWAAAMGNAWTTNDGSTISDEDKTAIKDAIVAAKGGGGGQDINIGLAADHAINRYWNKAVPVIEAANASISRGQAYWQNPEVIPAYGGKRFAVNLYYHKFQYYNEEVHSRRVRSYSVFAPAEFFAEVYTVYYEEAGQVPDAELGRLVPVGSWRDWITTNVHNRGQAPGTPATAGASPTAGMKAGNPGM